MFETRLSDAQARRPASADIVVGLGYGDEGKGATVDALVAHRNAARVVRFNGGQQAAHNVVVNGRHHTFASYGSGTFAGVPTFVSKHCTIDPIAISAERRVLGPSFHPMLYVHEDALVTTPFHVVHNLMDRRFIEHGTTGTGFGTTIEQNIVRPELSIRASDLVNFDVLVDKMRNIMLYYSPAPRDFDAALVGLAKDMYYSKLVNFCVIPDEEFTEALSFGHTVFEGAQGFGLDQDYGVHPHTTWSTTTPKNALELCANSGVEDVVKIGCLRTYATRHGNGPMPHEGKLGIEPVELHNGSYGVQGAFRTGKHSASDVQMAMDFANIDVLSVGHIDVFDKMQTNRGDMDPEEFGRVFIKSYGPNRQDRIFQY